MKPRFKFSVLTRDPLASSEVRTADTAPGLTLFWVVKCLANWFVTQALFLLLFKLPLILSPIRKPLSWPKREAVFEFAKWVLVLAFMVTQADAIAVTLPHWSGFSDTQNIMSIGSNTQSPCKLQTAKSLPQFQL